MDNERFATTEEFLKIFLRTSTDPQHDWSHADRVRRNALRIADHLEVDGIDLNLLQVICLLHDAHYTMYRLPLIVSYWFENWLARRAVKELVKRLRLTEAEKVIIIEAVGQHAHSFPLRDLHRESDIYTKILQDADTLDFFNRKRVKKFKKRNWFTALSAPAVDGIVEYGRDQIERYLNYPRNAELLPEVIN